MFSLKDQMKKAVPFLEVCNREQLLETGQKYKEEIMKLKSQLVGQGILGTHELFDDYDPDIKISKESLEGSDDESQSPASATYGQSKLSKLFSIM